MKLEIKTECSHIETFCVYQQWFYKVFLSPCSDVLYVPIVYALRYIVFLLFLRRHSFLGIKFV